jgi:hypothetical protein
MTQFKPRLVGATPAAPRRSAQARIQNSSCLSSRDLLTRARPLLALRTKPIVIELSADFGSASGSILPIVRKVAAWCHDHAPAPPLKLTALLQGAVDYVIMLAMRSSGREEQKDKELVGQFLEPLAEFDRRLESQLGQKVGLLLKSLPCVGDQADLEWLRLLLPVILLMLLCATLDYGSFVVSVSAEPGGGGKLRILLA